MQSKVLAELTNSRYNNLNILRFVASIMVIICHAIPICYGEAEEDIVGVLTQSQLNLGGIAVGVFFVTGGYLIAKSSERHQHAIPFLGARIKRIFPSLILLVFVCTFIIGPVLTRLPIGEYFSNINTYKYLMNMLLIPTHTLPGVFENNIYARVVNGSLWTLPVEFACYIACFTAYKLGFFNQKQYKFTIPIVLVGALLFFWLCGENVVLVRSMRPVMLYYIGIGYYVFREQIPINTKYGMIAILLFILLIIFNLPTIGMLIVFPYMIYFLAFGISGKLCQFGKKYELSYGMYLWAWPIQQILVGMDITDTWYENALATTLLVIICGFVNCILIEQNKWMKR